MKIVKLVIILILFSSCVSTSSEFKNTLKTTFKKEIEDNNIIYFENKEYKKKFDDYIPFIENIVSDTLQKTKSLYHLEYLDIFIRCKKYDWAILPHLGVGGQWINKNTIQVIINIDFFDSDSLLRTNLERVILHELGHTVHYKNRTKTNTLFEAIISEGIADHFEGILTGLEPQIWSINLSNEELEMYLDLAKGEIWSKDFDYEKCFFGKPSWIGYSLGYKIIKDYLINNPDMSILDIIKLPDDVLYESM